MSTAMVFTDAVMSSLDMVEWIISFLDFSDVLLFMKTSREFKHRVMTARPGLFTFALDRHTWVTAGCHRLGIPVLTRRRHGVPRTFTEKATEPMVSFIFKHLVPAALVQGERTRFSSPRMTLLRPMIRRDLSGPLERVVERVHEDLDLTYQQKEFFFDRLMHLAISNDADKCVEVLLLNCGRLSDAHIELAISTNAKNVLMCMMRITHGGGNLIPAIDLDTQALMFVRMDAQLVSLAAQISVASLNVAALIVAFRDGATPQLGDAVYASGLFPLAIAEFEFTPDAGLQVSEFFVNTMTEDEVVLAAFACVNNFIQFRVLCRKLVATVQA